MSFSSIADMLSAAQERAQPLYAVIRDADCLENGYDAAASHRQIAALWAASLLTEFLRKHLKTESYTLALVSY